jgi:phosphoadenosine phosphosulfate reductase
MFTASIARGTPGSCHRTDETTTFSPVWNWTTNQTWGHIARYEIPVNPVYEKLRRLGAPKHAQRVSSLLDAGHLELGRMVWLKRGWPELYQVLVDALPRAAEYA